MGPNCRYLAKNVRSGPNLAVFVPKILNFSGVSKGFGTHITEKHQGNLFALFFGRALVQMGQKCPYLVKNVSFGQIWLFLGQNSFFWGDGIKLLVQSYQETNETPFSC